MAEKRGRRPDTRFLVYSEKWILGSTRMELEHDERAIFVDLLALASMNGGCFEVFSRVQLSSQLFADVELINRTLKKCMESGKIGRKYNKREKKEVFYFKKWERYQPEYLWKRPERLHEKKRSVKNMKDDAHIGEERKGKEKKEEEKRGEDTRREEERRGEEKREEERRGEKSTENMSPNDNFSDSPLHSTSTPSFDEREHTIKEQFIGLLKGCKGYPFDEAKDSFLFDITIAEHPNIDIIKQTLKKVTWWRDHPDALKSNPREKLEEWFKEEAEFKKRGGPQKVGEILKEFKDPDHRNFIKEFLK